MKWAFTKTMLGVKARGSYTLDDLAADGFSLLDMLGRACFAAMIREGPIL
jgi:hypothetical protein